MFRAVNDVAVFVVVDWSADLKTPWIRRGECCVLFVVSASRDVSPEFFRVLLEVFVVGCVCGLVFMFFKAIDSAFALNFSVLKHLSET